MKKCAINTVPNLRFPMGKLHIIESTYMVQQYIEERNIVDSPWLQMYSYMTRGYGFEQDNKFARDSYFMELERSGYVLYGLTRHSAQDLAGVFWFGGAGYIGGWGTPEMYRYTANVMQLRTHPELTCQWLYNQTYPSMELYELPTELFNTGREIGMYVNIDRRGVPKTRWFNPKEQLVAGNEEVYNLLTGKTCLHEMHPHDVRACSLCLKHEKWSLKAFCKCGTRIEDDCMPSCQHHDRYFHERY